MSRFILLIIIIVSSSSMLSFSQTNTFPVDGNVGIGTLNPNEKLTLSYNSNFATELSPPMEVLVQANSGGHLPSGTYYFVIVAVNASGLSLPSVEVTCECDGINTNRCTLSWNAVVGATSYRVFKGSRSNQQDRFKEVTQSNVTIFHYDDDLGATLGAPPAESSGFVNKIVGSGNSWISAGNFGIGTVMPGTWLDVTGPNRQLRLTDSDDSKFWQLSATSNTLGFRYQESELDERLAFLMNSSGNVGIGTATPAGKLHLYNSEGEVGLKMSVGGSWITQLKLTDASILSLTNGGDIERLSILPNGNIGIGTTSPQAKLHIASGDLQIAGGTDGNTLNLNTHFNYRDDGKNYIRGTTIIADNGGNVGIGTATPTGKLHLHESKGEVGLKMSVGGSWVTQLKLTDASILSLTNGGDIERLSILPNGNVGIGTTSPQSKLDIKGSLRVTDSTTGRDLLTINPNRNNNNDKVVLPQSSISNIETLNEPGVASMWKDNNSVKLTHGWIVTLAEQTITTPTSGFVVAMCNCELKIDLKNRGGGPRPQIGITTFPDRNKFRSSSTVTMRVDGNAPETEYDRVAQAQGVFQVGEGSHQFFCIATENNSRAESTVTIKDTNLILMFFPTAYGENTLANN